MNHNHPPDTAQGKIVQRGAALVDGAKFHWTCDTDDVLEVWNWRYGRSCRSLSAGAETNVLIRRTAMDLMARHADRLGRLQHGVIVKSTVGTWSDSKSLCR